MGTGNNQGMKLVRAAKREGEGEGEGEGEAILKNEGWANKQGENRGG
jgi:hypothetical protein